MYNNEVIDFVGETTAIIPSKNRILIQQQKKVLHSVSPLWHLCLSFDGRCVIFFPRATDIP